MTSSEPFEGLEAGYAQLRPDYPHPVLSALAEHAERALPHAERAVALDVGAGTGISTRALARALGPRFLCVAVEPGEGMRAQAKADHDPTLPVRHVGAAAERLPFRHHSCTLVMAAQALHWFDRPVFYDEARRVLAARGLIAVLQNNRELEASSFMEAYETFLEENSPGYHRDYRAFDMEAELAAAGFAPVQPVTHRWERTMTHMEFTAMTLTSTRMQGAVRRMGEPVTIRAVLGILETYAPGGRVTVPYRTELFVGINSTP